ncbi:MAG: GMC oxidoreductase [Rhodococcus sp. (in: high G+C Gram-positive bacteria)]|uniref:GMC oxidoreductase n=1 Tax=Rhodococcus sp. SBT000017 TaxID=1803385 RepID=UPI000EF88939|nr:GMC oxidoreductase [Rhodococcus sp. SBT000017]RMB76542.1 GMC family oxidoreductase [Rhodococcus sp. SBT000017]
MDISRRRALQAAALLGVSGASAFLSGARPAAAAPILDPVYRAFVPELWNEPLRAPEHSESIIVGSGFGAAIAARRLTESGSSVTVLERGSQWPLDARRQIFANDFAPDGRAFWRRGGLTPLTGLPMVPTDRFGGIFDVTEHGSIDVWRAAAVGGGSLVFTGVMIAPERRFFDSLFGSTVSYDEMDSIYFPRVRSALRLSSMPDDVYASMPFTHSRIWDAQARRAGYSPRRIDGIWNWDVVRAELSGAARPSATIGESNLGNSNGAKFDLTQNYLADAQRTSRARIHARHEVTAVSRAADGRYVLEVDILDPGASVVESRTLTCDRLFLGAGSMGTSELLVAARDTGALPDLNEHVGQGWGTNGDAALVRGMTPEGNGIVQASPSASRIFDESGSPLTLENWYVPGSPIDMSLIGSLGMVLDSTRGEFVYDRAAGKTQLRWPEQGNRYVEEALRAVHDRIAHTSGVGTGFPLLRVPDVNASFTAHPLGGAVLGKATDGYGRVVGYDGLYVVDGALIPGSTGAVNPSLTIAALAERNIEEIIASGR